MNEELIFSLNEASLIVHNLKHKTNDIAPQGAFNMTLLMLQRIIAHLEENEFEYDEEIDEMFDHDVRFMGYYQAEIEEIFGNEVE